MASKLHTQVWQRAQSICEYCRMPQQFDPLPHEVDHIISRKAGGPTQLHNLALACFSCNNHKGPNLSGIDPEGDPEKAVQLYHPRKDDWREHLEWQGAVLIGRTPTGRETIEILQINLPMRVELRQWLIAAGVFPPDVTQT